MKPSTAGQAQPDSVKMGSEASETKTRTYTTPDGESFTISEEDFSKVVEIFEYLRKSRDGKNTQVDTLELESCAQAGEIVAKEKVG